MQYQPQSRFALAPASTTQSLLGHVLGITAIGLLITGIAAHFIGNSIPAGLAFVALLLAFGLLFAINATRAHEATALALFYGFALLEGVGLAPLISTYVGILGGDVVLEAAATTGLGMLALACIVYVTGLDLRRFAGYFFLALIGLVLFGIVSIFTHFVHPEAYSWATLVIFTGLVLIDFARIRAGGDGFTAVQIAVQIYLDAINIFLAILQLLALRRRN